MKRLETITAIVVVALTAGAVVGVLVIEHVRRATLYDAEIIARAPENGNFFPSEVRLQVDKPAVLQIRNIETVSHGFAIPEFNVDAGEIKAGNVKVVRFTPDKTGRFVFLCTVWCSEHHMKMQGTLVVEGPDPSDAHAAQTDHQCTETTCSGT